ncbi:DUF1080 domain-containing protein [Blastopirellula sp. JC732]|uniref:non-specific serine/threonine protein kinase n=1 Tax=Blastopirellula sediminis TaxID=2894196 RepID=A0A9X1MQN4_9BACT|nr:family 16 glycoside hydrolase [Blastopirellula sediminis]MCC9606111.1 DUF1080 domain-containing protein [Blastopirellula sediminis]MCC9630590.1 DUF1080 domain-containing protein [Blastopirellula sediminis]
MKIDQNILDLLLQWEEATAEGRPLDVTALTAERPDLAEALDRHIAALKRLAWLNQNDDGQPSPNLPSMQSLGDSLLLPDGVDLIQLQANLSKAEIVDPEKLNELLRVRAPKNAWQLSSQLLEASLLTRFQLRAIAHGKTRGLKLGRYVILDKIGEGGMGQVYRAWHSRMDREVALKVLPRESMSKADGVARFNQEVQVASQLSHPNIVTAFDADEAEGLHFLVMEFVNGKDLSSIVRRDGPLSVSQAIDCVTQAARGLEYAHSVGLVHRDIKPANLLLDDSGVVKILDMGIARMEGSDDTNLTQNGVVMGTIDYMAPEQAIDAKSVDGRADIYSLGCSLYFLLTRRPPFTGETLMAKLLAHRDVLPPKLQGLRKDIPAGLELIYQKCMAKRPDHRYANATELIADLEKLGPQASGAMAPIGLQRPEAELETSPTGVLETQAYVGTNLAVSPARSLVTELRTKLRLPDRFGVIFLGIVGLVLLLIGGYFGMGFLFQGPGAGNLSISISDDDLVAHLRDQVVTIVNEKTNKSTDIMLNSTELDQSLTPGDYRFVLESTSGIKTDSSRLTISNGEDSQVRIYWEPPTPDPTAIVKNGETEEMPAAPADGKSGEEKSASTAPPIAASSLPEIEVPNGTWVDLLSQIQLPDHVIFGDWSRSGTSLVGNSGIHRRVMAPYAIKGDYLLEMEFTRSSGDEAVGLHLPVADTSCDFLLSGWQGRLNGLRKINDNNLDRQPQFADSVKAGPAIANGKRHKVLVQVKAVSPFETNIRVALDDVPYLDWTGDNQSLINDAETIFPLVQAPGIFLFSSPTEIHSFRLQHLQNGEGRQLGDDWGYPFFPVANEAPSYLDPWCLKWNGKSYYISAEKVNLPDAQRIAKRYHGRLLTISSEAEQAFIFEHTKGQNFWMSGWRNMRTAGWRDDRGRKMTFQGRWAPGQPDNTTSNSEFFLGGYYPSADQFGWNDYPAHAACFAIIEWGEEDPSGGSPPSADTVASGNGWQSIFNGRDLTGWQVQGPPGWRVEDQQIVADGESYQDAGWLMLEQPYDAYELEFEYSLGAGGNSGIFLDGDPTKSPLGAEFLEIQLLDDDAPQFRGLSPLRRTGSLYGLAPATILMAAQKTPWRKVRVSFDGKTATVYINDAMVMTHQLSRQHATGHIGLQRHTGRVAFRNLRVRDLNEAASSTTDFALPASSPWVDLLSLVELPDHELNGTWRQRDGSVIGIGGGRGQLILPYEVTGSYELETEVTRLDGDKGIALHLPIGSATCNFVLSSSSGPLRGFQAVDGIHLNRLNPSTGLSQWNVDMVNGKKYKLEISVQLKPEDRVQLSVALDGKRIAHWTGVTQQLSQTPGIVFPHPDVLGLYVNQTSAEFHSLKLRHLGDGEGKPLQGDWKSSYSKVADRPPAAVIGDCELWNGRYYYHSPERMKLDRAQRLAVAMNGRLLLVSSPEEGDAIRRILPNDTIWTAAWRRNVANEWYDERNRRLSYFGTWDAGGGYDSRPLEQFMAFCSVPPSPWEAGRTKYMDIDANRSLTVLIEWGEEYPAAQTPRTYVSEPRLADLDPQQGNMIVQLDEWDVTPSTSVFRDLDGYLQMNEPDTTVLTKKTDWGAVDVRFVVSASKGTEAYFVFEKQDNFAITSSIRDDQNAISVGYQGLNFAARESGKTKVSIPYEQDFELRFRTRPGGRWIDVNGAMASGIAWSQTPSGAIGIQLKKGSLTIKRVEIMKR